MRSSWSGQNPSAASMAVWPPAAAQRRAAVASALRPPPLVYRSRSEHYASCIGSCAVRTASLQHSFRRHGSLLPNFLPNAASARGIAWGSTLAGLRGAPRGPRLQTRRLPRLGATIVSKALTVKTAPPPLQTGLNRPNKRISLSKIKKLKKTILSNCSHAHVATLQQRTRHCPAGPMTFIKVGSLMHMHDCMVRVAWGRTWAHQARIFKDLRNRLGDRSRNKLRIAENSGWQTSATYDGVA